MFDPSLAERSDPEFECAPKVEPTIADDRLASCLACSDRTAILGVNVCSACHCVIKFKTKLLASHCPKGKWKV